MYYDFQSVNGYLVIHCLISVISELFQVGWSCWLVKLKVTSKFLITALTWKTDVQLQPQRLKQTEKLYEVSFEKWLITDADRLDSLVRHTKDARQKLNLVTKTNHFLRIPTVNSVSVPPPPPHAFSSFFFCFSPALPRWLFPLLLCTLYRDWKLMRLYKFTTAVKPSPTVRTVF